VLHKVIIIGNLIRDPEMRFTPGGTAVTNFTVATTNKIAKSRTPECPDGWKEGYGGSTWEQTIFWGVTAWKGLAESVNEHLAKGRQVYIEGTMSGAGDSGRLAPRIWTGNDGTAHASFEITAREVKFLGHREGGGGGDAPESPDAPPPDFVEDNEIPF